MDLNKWIAEGTGQSYQSGLIMEGTECPFIIQCPIKAAGNCWHQGKDHNVPYFCHTARLFELRFMK